MAITRESFPALEAEEDAPTILLGVDRKDVRVVAVPKPTADELEDRSSSLRVRTAGSLFPWLRPSNAWTARGSGRYAFSAGPPARPRGLGWYFSLAGRDPARPYGVILVPRVEDGTS